MQFNPHSALSDDDFVRLHDLLGQNPERTDEYVTALIEARTCLGRYMVSMMRTWEMKMARMDGNWSLTVVGVLFLALQPQACRDEVTSHTLNDSTDVKPFLTDFAVNVVSERLTLMSEQNAGLVSALESASADVSSADLLLEAQQKWFDTMIQWQELEVMQVASLGSSLTTVGGQDVRDNIYSWYLSNPCQN